MVLACRGSIRRAWGCSRCVSVQQNWAAHASSKREPEPGRASTPGCQYQRSEAMEPLRVLIADDHPLFRHGLSTLLSAAPDFEVVGEATTGEEVMTQAATLQP